MVFASVEFLGLFLPLFFLVYLVTPGSGRNFVLMMASWVFYAWWQPVFLTLLIVVTALGWGVGLVIEARTDDRSKQHWLAVGAVLNIGVLAYFKYANLLVGTVSVAAVSLGGHHIPWQNVILPIGLSFYILHALSYLYDVRREVVRAEPSFVAFAAYVGMFTQLVAGPVIRYRWVDKELLARRFSLAGFALGARRFMLGFMMKVLVADSLAPFVNHTFDLPRPSFVDAWAGSVAYGLQLYFDFAGYSAMAIGLGVMLGFHFPENFDDPYLSRSIQDFWHRWHISLSGWLRDYLYIPLGGNRLGAFRTYVNLILTMGIGGLWHGAGWTFLAWGLVHGAALVVERWGKRRGLALPLALAYPLTMIIVFLAWTLFRASDWTMAEHMLAGQFGLHGFGPSDAMLTAVHPTIRLWFSLGLAIAWWPALRARFTWFKSSTMTADGGWWAMTWPVIGFVYALAVMEGHATIPFLYFQF